MRKCHNYTLIELIAVIMLLLLITGVVISQFRKMPAFISLDRKVNEIKRLCSKARNTACCQGTEIKIILKMPEKTLYINTGVKKEDADDSEQKLPSDSSVTLPEEITFKVNDRDFEPDEETYELFKFFPDGTGMEQSITFQLRKHKIRLRVSPLTGAIETDNVE
jgi:hypothetical protein